METISNKSLKQPVQHTSVYSKVVTCFSHNWTSSGYHAICKRK